jgi:hypothetical protein
VTFAKSKSRACAVTNYLKNARQSLLAMTNVKKKWDDYAQNNEKSVVMESTACKKKDAKTGECLEKQDVTLVSQRVSGSDNPEVNKLNTLTSQELVDASGFKEEAKAIEDEFKKCFDENGQGDDEACKKFLKNDQKEKLKELAEMDIRSRAIEAKLNSPDFDDEEVKKYLKEQGYTDAQIGDKLQDQAKLDMLKEEIKAKYAAERENLIKNLRDQINSKTVDGELDRTRDDPTLRKIADEMGNRTKKFAQLVHFNNIVSGYLEIEDETGSKTRNTASLYAEINDSSSDVVSDENQQILDEIRQVATDAGVTESDDGESDAGASPSLKVDELNSQILQYENLDE